MLIRNKKIMICSYLLTHEAPEDFFPEKRQDFRLSRSALKGLTKLDDLEIDNHLAMSADSSIKVSISHTKGLGCAAADNSDQTISIGVDIEWSDRKFRSGVEKFFFREEDDKSLSLIELWSCKESAFKCLSPIYKGEKTLVVKDFVIDKGRIIFEGRDIGEICVEKIDYLGRELIISQGRILKNSSYFDS